jgi:Protein of unknown function (DUF3617)
VTGRRLPLALAAFLSGCGALDTNPQKPGEWEVTIRVAAVDYPGISEADKAELIRAMVVPPVRQCLDDPTHQVGDKTLDGACVFTRIADSGTHVSHSQRCDKPGRDTFDTVEVSGTRSAQAYTLHVVTTRRKRGVATLLVASTDIVETGRRIGPCSH